MKLSRCRAALAALLALGGVAQESQADDPDPAKVREALLKAVTTMQEKYSRHGGYVWVYSADGMVRAGEGNAGETAAWIQPPGTPTVGEAYLAAYRATGDLKCRGAARQVAEALIQGQLQSGGWYYRVEFEKDLRKKYHYRVDGGKVPKADGPAGWDTWKRRKNKGNQSMLDDDTTQAALRFLLNYEASQPGGRDGGRFDQAVATAIDYGLETLRGVQYPVGAWSHNFDSFPDPGPGEAEYPVLKSSYPDEWPRTWPKSWDGCYHLNDNITTDCIRTLLLASELRGDVRSLEAAKRGGEFLIRAQMPEPQPAWAQQYDKNMHPVWERKFEPPAVTGGESQGAMEVLMELYAATKDKRFLGPVPRALAYLGKSETSKGKLARYYELKTNKPLYFTKDYKLTGDSSDVPDHYAFTVGSRLDRIERDYQLYKSGKAPKPRGAPSDKQVIGILKAANADGVWLEDGTVRGPDGKKVKPVEGVLFSATFAKNVGALSAWLQAH